MAVDLTPKQAQKFYGSDGGSYYIWLSSDVPILSEAKVGAGKLILAPRGLALPHYADAFKIGYIVQGCGVAGVVVPEGPKEMVVRLKQGDAIPLKHGEVSWWYNDGDSEEFIVVFLGESSEAYTPGQFTYSFLAGAANNILRGFSTESLSRAWNLDEEVVTKLLKSQSGQIVVKVKEGIHIPEPCESDARGIVFNFKAAPLDADVKSRVRATSLTIRNLPLLGEIGLSAKIVKLDANAMCSPGYTTDSSVQVIYIVKGSGRVEIVGTDGSRALEAKVSAGTLFVVPRFFVATQIADGEGMEWFSVITNPLPSFSYFGGTTSVLNALSPQLLEAAFDVTPELVKLLKSKGSKDAISTPSSH